VQSRAKLGIDNPRLSSNQGKDFLLREVIENRENVLWRRQGGGLGMGSCHCARVLDYVQSLVIRGLCALIPPPSEATLSPWMLCS